VQYLSDAAARGAAGVFEKDHRIQVAYLFGSSCRGSQVPESDTDIAVMLSELPEDMLDYYLDLTDKLTRLFGDRIDLAILNEAPPVLSHQVIKTGKVIYCRDERARVQFEARALRQYLDLVWLRERYDGALMEEISKWKR